MWKILPLVAVLMLASPMLTSAAQAASPRDKLLVTPAWLAAHLADKNLVILHAGSQADFAAGHVAGARLVARESLATTGPAGLILEFPNAETLRKELQDLGVSDRSRIVVYAGSGAIPAATRIVFTLDTAGLGDRVSLLDGGLAEWTRAGHTTTAETPTVAKGRLSPLKIQPRIVDAAFVRDRAKAAGYDLLDARAGIFYDGLRPDPLAGPAGKLGHIPGARNFPATSVTTADNRLKSPEALAAAFQAAGVKPGDRVVVYCHVGQIATAVILAARTLGISAQLYDGSYQDWTIRGLPVEAQPGASAK